MKHGNWGRVVVLKWFTKKDLFLQLTCRKDRKGVKLYKSRVPTRTGKPGKEKGEGIFQSGKSQGILNRPEVRENHTNTGKVREFQKNVICYF